MRRSVALLLAVAAVVYLEIRCVPYLRSTKEFRALRSANATTAAAVEKAFGLGLWSGIPLFALGAVHFLEVHGWFGEVRRRRKSLPPWPFDPKSSAVVLGEVHAQDGSESEKPGWLVVPESGLYTGILVVGATGRGKTSGALYPLLEQLVSLKSDDSRRKLAGLVIDAKGNMSQDVRRMLEAVGRGGDYYEISIPTARYNLLNRPDLSAAALGGHVADLIANVTGGSSSDPFWPMAAKELAFQAIRALRLAKPEPPTFAELYRISASPETFDKAVKAARDRRVLSEREREELESLETWAKESLRRQDPRTRSNIAANLNMLCSLFDEPEIRRCFCPGPAEETFPGFDALLDEGKVVVLSLPRSRYKAVSDVVATAVKLNFQDAVLGRLARGEGANADVGRSVFFLADEYGNYVTAPGDATFLSQCREARCMTVLAVQSYESLMAKLRNQAAVEVLLANLATKVWLGLEDIGTAVAAAELCGKVERLKETVSVSEGAQQAAFSFLDGRSVSEGSASNTASTSWSPRLEHLFSPSFFTGRLATFQAVAKVFDGVQPRPPWVVYLKRLDQDRSVSWFDRSQFPS